jgi:hypothetical protein
MIGMRVLLVHHGPLRDDDSPLGGGALRARTHARVLAGAGHEVLTLARAQDDETTPDGAPRPWRTLPGFRSPGDLTRLARSASADAIVCVAPEEAPALAGVAPLAVDLYAPRLLEGAFEGLQREEAGRTLAALAVADEVFFSNPRQRWFFLGLLGAAGWDLSRPAGRLVPLAAVGPDAQREGADPGPATFVLGGPLWPWQDATDTVRRAAVHLRGRARLRLVGMQTQPGFVEHAECVPRMSRGAWLTTLRGAAGVLDRWAPNPERALATGFRQMDAIAVGAPLLTDDDTPLADEVRAHAAGWVGGPLEDAIDAAMRAWEARPSPAREAGSLAGAYAPERTSAPLLAWVNGAAPRERRWNLLEAGADLARAEARAAVAEHARAVAEAEVAAKRAEVEALNATVRALAGAVEANAAAVADVAAFRRETVTVLGTRLAGREAEAEHLARELAIAREDAEKKTRELEAAQADRDRVGRALRALRGH